MAELFTGYVLFQNDSVPTMLSRITGILGSFPPHVLINGKDSGKYFTLSNIVYERDEDGSFHLIFPKKTMLSSRLHLDPRRSYVNKSEAQQQDEDLFVDFVRELLLLDPRLRVTASQALHHPWLRDADTVKFSEYIIGQPVAPPPPPQSIPLPKPDNATEYDDDEDDDD
jgi:serine/threonine protein kinase